jgi:hypothetical protein
MVWLALSCALFAQEAPAAPWSEAVPRVPQARHFYAAPDGKPENPGTAEAPSDLAGALAGRLKLAPGDVLWVRGGAYRGKFEVRLAGAENAPVHVRTYPGERATILDSGLTVVPGTDDLWIWDLELAGSIPNERRETKQTGSWPSDLPGTGGLTIHAGKRCKYVNLLIHDNVHGGVGWWVGSTDSEMHGCVIYGNGWRAPDRTHGHSIYVQNKDGTKTISQCILSAAFDGGQYTMHAYGSGKAFVDNFVIEDNIAYEFGPFLVGGGRPSTRLAVRRNYLHRVGLQIGYTSKENEDCEVRDNVVPHGLTLKKFKKVVEEGNVRELPASKAVVLPNKYDPTRAHVAVYNGAKAAEVNVDVGGFLKPGDSFRLLHPRDFYGKPVLEGKVEAAAIRVPVAGEFAAFVLVKAAKP